MAHRVMGFVDGENMVLRYQDMIKDGRTPRNNVEHEVDLIVWHPNITNAYFANIVRMTYYQTVVGDTDKLDQACERISGISYSYDEGSTDPDKGKGVLRPRVFKKEAKSAKTKSVDINLTVDMLRHSSDTQLDVVLLVSGDGDYLPLVEEVARKGKQVWVAAFSKGLNRRLRFAADEFVDLDELFFTQLKQQS